VGAVKNQPGLSAPDRLAARYGGVPVVYVEAEEDRYVFGECWFKDRLARMEFRAADSSCGYSGCNAVIEAVTEERSTGNPAWGIVDRDAVMAKDLWSLVHEADDDIFTTTSPFGGHIKVLLRWELENYLVDSRALEKCRAEKNMESVRDDLLVDTEILGHCEALIPHAAANALLHKHKAKGLPDGYTNPFDSRDDVTAAVVKQGLSGLSLVEGEYEQQLRFVEAFDLPEADAGTRVSALLRRIHGKALLKRYTHKERIQHDIKGQLANRIKEMSRIPSELEAFIAQVAN
jgi:hypothetical protein